MKRSNTFPTQLKWLMKAITRTRILIFALIAICVTFGAAIPKIEIQNDVMFMIPDDNKEKVAYQDAEETYGNTGGIVISITSDQGIYDPGLIRRVHALSKGIKEL